TNGVRAAISVIVLDLGRSPRVDRRSMLLPFGHQLIKVVVNELDVARLITAADRIKAGHFVESLAIIVTPRDPAHVVINGTANGGDLLGRLATEFVIFVLMRSAVLIGELNSLTL